MALCALKFHQGQIDLEHPFFPAKVVYVGKPRRCPAGRKIVSFLPYT
jgi:hypothetical protein